MKNTLTVSGYSNDLLNVSKDGTKKIIRLFNEDYNDETIVSLEMVSTSKEGKHALLDSFLDRKIEITIQTVD